MSFSNDDGLTAKEIINGENPEDVEGVSSIEQYNSVDTKKCGYRRYNNITFELSVADQWNPFSMRHFEGIS